MEEVMELLAQGRGEEEDKLRPNGCIATFPAFGLESRSGTLIEVGIRIMDDL